MIDGEELQNLPAPEKGHFEYKFQVCSNSNDATAVASRMAKMDYDVESFQMLEVGQLMVLFCRWVPSKETVKET